LAARAFIAAKLASVGDVIEETAIRHQLSAYYENRVGANALVRGTTARQRV
jgi:hypothetical protein